MTSYEDKPFETIGMWPALIEAAAGREPTVAAQQAVLKAGYGAIDRRVAPLEKALIARAQTLVEDLQNRARAARELAAELRTVAEFARDGAAVDLDVYSAADGRAAQLVGALRDAPERAAKLAEDLSDPLAVLDSMEQRTPPLRQHLPI